MLSSRDRRRESPMFQLTEELTSQAKARARELVASGETRAFVQESPDSPSFLLTKDESEVTALQRIDVDGAVFYLGLSKTST